MKGDDLMNVYQKLKACITELSGGFDENLALAGAGAGGGSFSAKPERRGVYNFQVNNDGTVSMDMSHVREDDSTSETSAPISQFNLS